MMKIETAVRIKPRVKAFSGIPPMTPYLNMFFILVIFFILGTTKVPIRGTQVVLPRSNGEHFYVDADHSLFITIDRSGVIYFNDKRLSNSKQLKDDLAVTVLKGKESIVILADAATPLQMLIEIFEFAREQNIKAIMMTDPPRNENKNDLGVRE